ncbi:MAG TPA: ABC transporter substrate-binding protein [Actinocrinis sp.]|jgi:NitT/TauT family transport system substrate-binding protein|uniref:ABC transporter substrate-binding protein n=1 Tax=Actinocrinis sp. TaxID=1920516 RepID=UPI002DDC9ECC|nr:ABC transporter substrate-binding protein [Actinocrinis sp.]HEV3173798.1 ABC transporter substrate-binding protein [Actinocrinis sp.]
MFRRKSALLAIAAVTALSGIAGCSSNSPATAPVAATSPVLVRLSVSNLTNQNYIPLILAQRLGLFAKQGLNVQITNVTNGSQTFQMMLAKQVDGVVGFYDHNIDLASKGTGTESVIQLLQAPGMVELARADEAASITSPADLSGKNVGITGLGGSTEFLADYLAAHNGVPVNQIHPVNVAAGPTFVAAMQHNSIDAGITTEPTISQLLAKHLGKVIVDMRSAAGTQAALGGPYPGTALTFPTAWVESHTATVQKVVDALVQSLRWIQQHSAEQITDQMPADYYQAIGKTSYVEALANEIGMFSPTGLMVTDGPQSVFRVLSAFDPTVKGHQVDLAKTYTDQFVQQVPSS